MRQARDLVRRFAMPIGLLDVVMALGLTVWSIAEGSGRGSYPPINLLATVPLLVRRRWPVPVFVLAIAGAALGGQQTGIPAIIGAVAATVTLGIHARQRKVAIALVAITAIGLAFEYGGGGQTTLPIPGTLLPFLLVGTAYLAGNEIGNRQREADQERQHVRQLERDHEDAIRTAAETERRHIARELHDVVAHSVSVMVVQAGAARQVLDDKPDAARASLLAVEASGHAAMAELRRLLGVLSVNGEDAPTAPQPGMDGLEALVTRVRDAGLPVQLRVEGSRSVLPGGLDVAAYRIIQEALTNALKYAGAAPTDVVVRYRPEAVELEVADDGAIVTPSDGIGRGLVGMRERVALFGGTIDAGPRPGRGYTVKARLPLVEPG